jgi:hypothetical protein
MHRREAMGCIRRRTEKQTRTMMGKEWPTPYAKSSSEKIGEDPRPPVRLTLSGGRKSTSVIGSVFGSRGTGGAASCRIHS